MAQGKKGKLMYACRRNGKAILKSGTLTEKTAQVITYFGISINKGTPST
jgi:hypothetical protein